MNKLNTEESLRQLMTTYTELHRLFCTSSKGEVASVTPSGNGWKIDFSEISSSVGSDQFCATTLDELALKGLQLLQTELEGRMGAQGKVLTDLTRVHTEILLRLKTIEG